MKILTTFCDVQSGDDMSRSSGVAEVSIKRDMERPRNAPLDDGGARVWWMRRCCRLEGDVDAKMLLIFERLRVSEVVTMSLRNLDPLLADQR